MKGQLGTAGGLIVGVLAALGGGTAPIQAESPPALSSAPRPAAGPPSHAVPNSARTRFVISLDRVMKYRVFSLSNPNRVIVELPAGKIVLPPPPRSGPVGLVKSFRGGMSAPGQFRAVIEVTAPVVVESAKIENGSEGKMPRLVIDIVPAMTLAPQKTVKMAAPFGLGAAGLQPPMPRLAVHPKILAKNAYKPLIVIDPGHGGHDSGAVKNGTVEKEVVLAFGLKLRDRLEASGRYRVLMTRDKDVFIPLGERTAFAERHNANLFIAVHADYAGGNSSARGATIYSLRQSVADALKRSAKDSEALSSSDASVVRKAGGSMEDLETVKGFLSYLAGWSDELTQDRTAQFTRTVVENMEDSTVMRSEPEQQASFRVLKTAQFPSVLIELAYVTNKEDAQLLKSDSWRGKVADSIATAVDNFFSHQGGAAALLPAAPDAPASSQREREK